MRVLVLGAGVVGVTAAWYLATDGHEVVVVDREAGPALETSFANGGQISASHAEPWANPEAPFQILRWLGREDAPLLFRLRADPRQWHFGLQFLLECLPWRTRRNTVQCLNLALYSLDCLKALRADTAIEYDHLERGILQFYTDRRAFDRGVATARSMRELGCDRAPKTVAECVAIEPALAQCRDRLAGGIYTASDESGDAQRFTSELARRAAARGVAFRWGTHRRGARRRGKRRARCALRGARWQRGSAASPTPTSSRWEATAHCCCARSASRARSIRPRAIRRRSRSARTAAHRRSRSPISSGRSCCRRLGDRLRVAGTAELSGYGTELNAVRCEALVRRTFDLFPDAGERASATFWTGLRPATPSNVPLVGRTRYRNLFLDTGHGTLGWTMACGSGRALADVIASRKPDVDFAFTRGRASPPAPLESDAIAVRGTCPMTLASLNRWKAAGIHLCRRR